eukprot:1152792-Pelagomonas_calceolata.AAC.1
MRGTFLFQNSTEYGHYTYYTYLSAEAPSSRWDVAMEYLPEDDSDDEGEEGQKAEEKKAEGQHQ